MSKTVIFVVAVLCIAITCKAHSVHVRSRPGLPLGPARYRFSSK